MSPEGSDERFGIGGRVAPVTGASRNIGRAIALTLAEAGARVMVLYHQDEAAADGVCEEIRRQGGKSAKFQADLCDIARLREIARAVEADIGGVDILVNNAALRPNTKISDITIGEWDGVFAINLRAPFFLAQAVLPHMVKSGWGQIVNIGGSDAYQGKARCAHSVSAPNRGLQG